MNRNAEAALVQILTSYTPLSQLIGDRATWDDDELDTSYPSVSLRSLTTRFPAAGLTGRGGVRTSLIEIAARSQTRLGASDLADLIVPALDPYERGPADIVLASGETVRIASIRLDDIQQEPSTQQRSYRKQLVYSFSFYE